MIYGRDDEILLIDAFFDQLGSGLAPVLVFEGPVGIGKTTLLAGARRIANGRGFAVRSGGGLTFQEDLNWRAGAELFGRPLPGLPDPVALVTAVIAELRELDQPTVVIVDDADRLDPVSAAALTAAVATTPSVHLGLILGGEVGGWPLQLEAALAEARAARPEAVRARRVAGLDRAAAAEMLAGRIPEDYLASVHLAAAGNPFLLGQVRLSGLPVDELVAAPPAPDRTYVAEELDRRSILARQLASAGAVLGDPFPLELATALAGQRKRQGEKSARELVQAEILIADGADGELRFRHPLIRVAAYERPIPKWVASAHAEAARRLTDRGAPSEVISYHWSKAASVDPDAVTEVITASLDDLAAIAFLGDALQPGAITGPEPPQGPGVPVAARLLEEVRAACAARRWDKAVKAAEQLQALVDADDSAAVQAAGARARAEVALAAGDIERAEAEVLLAAEYVTELGGWGMDEIQSLALRVDAAVERDS